jgi:hypothetical protein
VKKEVTFPDEVEVKALGEHLMVILDVYGICRKEKPEADVEINALLGVIYTRICTSETDDDRASMIAACRHFFDHTVKGDEAAVARYRAMFLALDSPAEGNA